MKTALFSALVASAVAAAIPAFADEKAACIDAASKGQSLRDAHKLVEARDAFRICARQLCPSIVQGDCGGWLNEVQKSVPTVVVTAKDGSGKDLVSVKVTVDGQPLLATLDGQAVETDPGVHAFHFEAAEGSLNQQVLVKEGEKNQAVAVMLGKAPASATLTPPSAAGSQPPPATGEPPRSGGNGPWKTIGWVVGAAGIAGLGVGTAFGLEALGDKNSVCGSSTVCGPLGPTRSAALGSDIGFIAGGVLLASGAALVLFAPSGNHSSGSAILVAPSLVATGGSVLVEGRW